MKNRHVEGVEDKLPGGTERTLKPEVVNHETEKLDGAREVGHCDGSSE